MRYEFLKLFIVELCVPRGVRHAQDGVRGMRMGSHGGILITQRQMSY